MFVSKNGSCINIIAAHNFFLEKTRLDSRRANFFLNNNNRVQIVIFILAALPSSDFYNGFWNTITKDVAQSFAGVRNNAKITINNNVMRTPIVLYVLIMYIQSEFDKLLDSVARSHF